MFIIRHCITIFLISCFWAGSLFADFSNFTKDTTILRSPNNQADYLIISADSFQSAISPLATHRENQGLTVRFAGINQIYQEFGDSLVNAKKIRHFVSYALEYWQSPKPKYLLIVGDTEIIPSYKLASSLASVGEDSVSIDEWFSINQFNTNNVTDIAIGRIPASNLNQAELAISRTLFFENNLVLSDYTQDFLVLADSFDVTSQIFEDMANQFIDIIEPYNFRISRIDIRKTSAYHGTLEDFIGQINNGVLFVNFFGFGIEKIWSRDTFLTINDLDSLENNDFPCIVITTARQNFDSDDDSTIAEMLLFNPPGGALAVFASSGECYLNAAKNIIFNLIEFVLNNPDTTLGRSILRVKKNYGSPLTPDNTLRRFTLLGDPALKLPVDFLSGLNTPRDNSVHAFRLKQNYPNPFNPSTTIQFDLPKTSEVSLKVFNILGEEVVTLVSDRLSAGSYSYEWSRTAGIASGVYLYRLEAEGFVQTRKMILIK